MHHVTLNSARKFRVVFEGIKGVGGASGGLSLDDINLSETECPHHTWRIRNFTNLLASTAPGVKHYSPRFTSRDGYTFQVGLYINGRSSPGSMAIYLHLTSGPNDDKLQWPCPWRQVTMALMDQNPDIRQRMTNYRMVTTDPDKSTTNCEFLFMLFTPVRVMDSPNMDNNVFDLWVIIWHCFLSADGTVEYYWDDPRKVGSLQSDEDGTQFYRGPGTGTSAFITHGRLKSRDYIKGHDAIFLLSLDGICASIGQNHES